MASAWHNYSINRHPWVTEPNMGHNLHSQGPIELHPSPTDPTGIGVDLYPFVNRAAQSASKGRICRVVGGEGSSVSPLYHKDEGLSPSATAQRSSSI